MVQATQAGNAAAALEKKGIRTIFVTQPGCMVTRDNVELVVKRLEEEYNEGDILMI